MKLFITTSGCYPALIDTLKQSRYTLESFYYWQDWELPLLESSKMFLLDSGAFSFLRSGKTMDWNKQLDRYIDFINQHKIKYFFELDIDPIIGYNEVLALRRRLENETHAKCIPVWHRTRGLNEWHKLCEEYDYVALGGIATKEIKPSEYSIFTKLNKIARGYETKVHALGYTGNKSQEYGFYSADSTTWLNGGKFGHFHIFENGKMKTITDSSKKAITKDCIIMKHSLEEFLKYQKYLERGEGK